MRHRNYAIEPIINSLETPRTSSRISAMRRVYDGITRSTTLSGTAESPWRGFSSLTADNDGEMITDATTTADFLFGFLLVHRNLGLSSKEHRDFWFSTTKMVSLSLHVGYSFAPTPPRWTPRDRYGVFTRSYEELRKLDAIDAVAPSRRRRRRSLSFSRICATRYALSD